MQTSRTKRTPHHKTTKPSLLRHHATRRKQKTHPRNTTKYNTTAKRTMSSNNKMNNGQIADRYSGFKDSIFTKMTQMGMFSKLHLRKKSL